MRQWGPAPARTRGQPIAAIALVLAAWIGFRACVIQLPLPPMARNLAKAAATPVPDGSETRRGARPAMRFELPVSPTGRTPQTLPPAPQPLPQRPVEWVSPAAQERQYSANQAMLWMAAMSNVPLPERLAGLMDRRTDQRADHRSWPSDGAPAHPDPQMPARPRSRWSGDGWLLLRQGADFAAQTGGTAPPVYGGSQAGAVIRYRLDPGSGHAASAYLRASQALSGGRDRELAAGLSARPLSGLPVTAHAELRATSLRSGTHLRPAAFLTAGFDHARLPLGISARGYAQAGYVAGHFASAFADGSLVADRRIARRGGNELSAGAGAWGGAQRGAKRLDLGPSASVKLSLGELPARVSLDYRLRVAGDAEPKSGAALTLSAGF